MVRSFQIEGTDEVMAMFSTPGEYYKGKWEDIRISAVGNNAEVPLEVRIALLGLTISTISLNGKFPI